MLYRTAGQFKTSYAADHALFPVRQDAWLLGGNTETWFAFMLALIVLLFRPQGLFGERIIERV